MNWEAWQQSWDRQQELYMPDREERFRVMLELVEASGGKSPRVLDLACGTGTISRRLFARLPEATSVAVDRDPTLLAMARGSFDGDQRIEFVTADLEEPGWAAGLGAEPFDAVLTATAMHWLQPAPLAQVFTDLLPLLRPGGVFINADHMPDPETPMLNALDESIQRAHQEHARAAGARDWDEWWVEVGADSALTAEFAASRSIFDNREPGVPQPLDWHLARLREAGFAEVGVAWRSVTDAVVVAIR
ncbi:class I SAM-dependent methyltransferase [Nocardia sp. 2]|uniref:Class I SAM-dependent methyltransferase n=1 Tax=Nocardia acididurans TaxID=2802282 RepID=A0ABS1MCF4_9NOCA|nr:class I SAM-dependent methyltransferase [Nocardia acididurans]MBL1076883.1 class I SAM-dependent methyltransferase [Nocardia acididurans]